MAKNKRLTPEQREARRERRATRAANRRERKRDRRGRKRLNKKLKTAAGQIQVQQDINDKNITAQAEANRVNVTGPTGSSTFTTNEDGSTTLVNELSPEQQALYDQQTKFGQQANEAGINAHARANASLSDPYTYDNLGAQSPYSMDYDAERQRIEDATYKRLTQNYDNRFGREQERLESQLLNQGLARGSEGWNNAIRDFRDSKQRAYSDASGQAVQMGGQEWQRAFDIGLRGRQQAISEYDSQRYAPLNEAQQMTQYMQGAQQGPNAPIAQISVPNIDAASIQQAQQAFGLQQKAFQQGQQTGGGGGFTPAPAVIAPPPPPPPSGSSGKSGSSAAAADLGAAAAGSAAAGIGAGIAQGIFG